MSAPKGEPIPINCEGSGSDPLRAAYSVIGGYRGMCPMCGEFVEIVACAPGAVILPHLRDDIVARIQRGDFE